MQSEYTQTYQRIRDFPLEPSTAGFRFGERLAREQRWSPAYADRVVEEYRRFLLIAAVAGHGVVPSDAVDQAWHQHVLDTQSYWGRFCAEVLQRPLHHVPSQGGEAERDGLLNGYRLTLASYRRIFGERAPADIWPGISERFDLSQRFVRVDERGFWLIRKPDWAGVRDRCGSGLWLGLLAVVLVGCGLEPGSWVSTESARHRGLSSLAALVLAALVVWHEHRRQRHMPSHRTLAPKDLDSYDWAYLTGGPRRVVQTALLGLLRERRLEYDPALKTLRPVETGTIPPAEHPVARHVLEAVGQGSKLATLHRHQTQLTAGLVAPLVKQGLLTDPRLFGRHGYLALPVSAVAAMAVYWLGGMDVPGGEPPAWLGIIAVVAGVASWVFLARPPYLSPRGMALFDSLEPCPGAEQVSHEGSLLNFARYGVMGLGESALRGIYDALYPKAELREPGGCGGGGCGGACGGCGGGCGGC